MELWNFQNDIQVYYYQSAFRTLTQLHTRIDRNQECRGCILYTTTNTQLV